MPTITIDIPADKAQRVADAFIESYGFDPNATNAQKQAFVEAQVKAFIKDTVFGYEKSVASRTAADLVDEITL